MPHTPLVATAQNYLYEHIPITRHLGVIVRAFDGRSIELAAPLEPNINHRATVFGGSLASVAILAGWTILHLKLLEKNVRAHLVIQKTSLEFLAPVTGDFTATCKLADESWESFFKMLVSKSKARLKLTSHIYADGKLACTQEGTFVAVIRTEQQEIL